MLKQLGYTADVAGNGEAALAALDRVVYDVVLMDIHLPGMDGLEATRRMRSRWPRGTGPRVVATTAAVLPSDRQRALVAGVDGFLEKPMTLDRLKAALGEEGQPLATPTSLDSSPDETRALQALAENTGGWGEAVDLVHVFLRESDRLFGDMRRALDAGDTAGVGNAAHTLKSSSSLFGGARLAQTCREIERRSRKGQGGDLTPLVAQAEAEFGRLRGVLERLAQQPVAAGDKP